MRDLHTIRIGDRVRVRQQQWVVAASRSYESCQVVTLTGTGRINGGVLKRVLLPFDEFDRHREPGGIRHVGLRRWRSRCRAMLGFAHPAGTLASAVHSRIDLLSYQLEPALAIVNGRGSRVLVADDVGLGKTIQAGLIVAELCALGIAERTLILAPAGLCEQWASELRDRFDLTAVIVDARETKCQAARLPIGINPWATWPLAIASLDYVKRPEVLPAVLSFRWDVVIIDEAHGVAIGTDRRHAAGALCERAPYVVLLTATPHSGDRGQFESLCGIGRAGSEPEDPLLVFRRTRGDVGLSGPRRIHRVNVCPSAPELRMHDLLARFTSSVQASNEPGDAERLALAVLHKRALSSARSLLKSLHRRESGSGGSADQQQLVLPLDDEAGELDSADEPPAWRTPAFGQSGQGRRMLEELADCAASALEGETKLGRLTSLLARLLGLGESVIVFTEYRDTLFHVRQVLQSTAAAAAGIAMLHGGLTREERRQALRDFRGRIAKVLLSTDAGGEGLNLHEACRVVVNLELPWNPMRLEQRIGRVDRIGQHRTVHVFTLIARNTGEVRILERLKARVTAARRDICAPDPLASRADEEDAAFRLVTFRNGGSDPTESADTSGDVVTIGPPTPEDGSFYRLSSFAAAAQAECARVRTARAFLSHRATTVPHLSDIDGATWFAFARDPVTRERLSSSVLVLLQSITEDRGGRVAAAEPVAFAVRCTSPVLRHGRDELIARVLTAIEPFRKSIGTTPPFIHAYQRLWHTRMAREYAIIDRLAELPAHVMQPGLFDRRVEFERDSWSSFVSAESRRVALLASSAVLNPPRAVVALVLLP